MVCSIFFYRGLKTQPSSLTTFSFAFSLPSTSLLLFLMLSLTRSPPSLFNWPLTTSISTSTSYPLSITLHALDGLDPARHLSQNLSPAMKAAPTSMMEQLMKDKFDGIRLKKMRDEYSDWEMSAVFVIRTSMVKRRWQESPCDHVYHKSYILKWLNCRVEIPNAAEAVKNQTWN